MTAQVRTVDGRVAGRRGQVTRGRLLECLREMLSTSPYRDVKVIDVARMAGTSPATFYQYFPEIETAILEIANETARDGSRLLAPLEQQSWSGKSGYNTAEALVDAFLDFWREHDAILRVVDLASAEGDKRFHKIRGKVLTAVSKALAESIANLQGKGRSADGGDPAAMASTLVTMLAAVSAQQRTLESGVRLKDLRHTMTSLVYWGVTGRKPPR